MSVLPSSESEQPWTAEFTPDSQVRKPGLLLREIAADLVRSQGLAWRLFVRNLSATYRQTALGWLWVLVPTLAQAGSWAFLVREKVLRADSIPGGSYVAFIAIGTVLWQAFYESVQAPLRAVGTNQGLITKLRFPRESLIMVGLYEVLLDFVIRMVVVLLLGAAFGVVWSWGTAWVPILAVCLILIGTVLGLWLTPLGVLYQDIPRTLMMIGPLWMLLTPVVYVAPDNLGYTIWSWINPPAGLLSVSRDLLTAGSSDMWGPALLWLLLTPPAAVLALVWFRIAFRIVIERMAN